MSIGSVGGQTDMLKNERMPLAVPEKAQDQAPETREDLPSAAVTHETSVTVRPERKDTALEDISITFNRQEDFEYIGRDSDIRGLDVKKAIDDMKRDQVLQQYQYFVGSSRGQDETEEADGVVIRKL